MYKKKIKTSVRGGGHGGARGKLRRKAGVHLKSVVDSIPLHFTVRKPRTKVIMRHKELVQCPRSPSYETKPNLEELAQCRQSPSCETLPSSEVVQSQQSPSGEAPPNPEEEEEEVEWNQAEGSFDEEILASETHLIRVKTEADDWETMENSVTTTTASSPSSFSYLVSQECQVPGPVPDFAALDWEYDEFSLSFFDDIPDTQL